MRGDIFFAWVDPDETEFLEEHERYDENVFSFRLEHNEGDFATLELEVRRPRNEAGNPVGLLAPGRKIWAWFAFDCGTDLVKFFGRLVGVTNNVLPEVVSIRFIARPIDFADQKADLAESLRVLPNYDPIFIDESRRDDPDAVLEGYSKIWAIDRETHEVTVSDILIGEDTSISLGPHEMDFEGLDMAPAGVPLTSVHVSAEMTWTQLARGTVSFTEYIVSNWPNEGEATGDAELAASGIITSWTFGADNWPQNGTSLGDGWQAANSSAIDLYDTNVQTKSSTDKITIKWWDGETTTQESSVSQDYLPIEPPGSYRLGDVMTENESDSKLGDWEFKLFGASQPIVSWSRRYSSTDQVVILKHTKPTLDAAYDSNRNLTELVSFVLTADMQPILTEPGDQETMRIDNLRSVNLSDPLGEDTGGELPIGDPRRRSYITTDRGQQSLQYMMAVARAHLRKKARAVELTISPRLGRFPEMSLRKSIEVNDPRLPDGSAFGKIINYSMALNGDDGKLQCRVKIGCPIGRGGTVTTINGDPVYVEEGYVQLGYQAYEGRTILFDEALGFTPPVFNPQDDGIDFLAGLKAEDVLAEPLQPTYSTANPAARTSKRATARAGEDEKTYQEQANEYLQARAEAEKARLDADATSVRMKLKSMTAAFSSPYEITTTVMKVPTGFNLESTG
jgi:hypothetical protein